MTKGNDSQDGKKGIGAAELTTGAVAGAMTGYAGGMYVGIKHQAPELIDQAGKLAHEAYDAFNAANPLFEVAAKSVSDPAAMQQWEKGLEAAVSKATSPVMEKALAIGNPLTGPVTVFRNASTPVKVAMGAAVAVAALGTAWAVNKWRNSGSQSHVERLEQERNSASHERGV